MPVTLHYPPMFSSSLVPSLFLAGPIQGAPDWQSEAINWFLQTELDINLYSPRMEYKPGEFEYETQVEWESRYLEDASRCGVILFWLAKEKTPLPGRAYAQTTRFELAEWITKRQLNPRYQINIVLGIEDGFSGAKYIRNRLRGSGIVIADTLEQTCQNAHDLLIDMPFIL